MVKGNAGLEIGILKVAVERPQGCGHGEALVADEAAGKGGDVKSGFVFKLALNFTTNKVEQSFEMIGVHVSGTADDEVVNFRLGEAGQFTQFVRVDRNLAPADERDFAFDEDGLGEGLNVRGDSFGEEKDSDSEIAGVAGIAKLPGCLGENGAWDLAENAGAVAGLHVGVDRPTVGHVADRGQGVVENIVGFLSTEIGNGSHSAVGGFIIPLVQSA